MSMEYCEKLQYKQYQQQNPQNNHIFENPVEGFSYHNEDEPLINYHQHYHQAQAQQQTTYPFTIHHENNTTSNNCLKEDQIYFLPQNTNSSIQHDNTGLSFITASPYHQNSHYNQQTPISNSSSSQQHFSTPFSLSLTNTSKPTQITSSNKNSSQTNFVFQNPNNSYQKSNNNNMNKNKQFFSTSLHYPHNNVNNSIPFQTTNKNQYNFDMNQESIFIPNSHQTQSQQLMAPSCLSSNTCTSQKTINNQGQQNKISQETFPSIQTLNDIDTIFSSTHDLQSTTNCSYTSQNQQSPQPLLQLNNLVHKTSAQASYFYTDNNINSNFKQTYEQAQGEQNCVERKHIFEPKNEETISSQNSLCEKYIKSPKNQSSVPNPIRKGSDSNSDVTKTSTTLCLNKQQSQLKNANKFCMVSLLNFLTDILPNSKEFHHLIKYIIRVKGSGKMRQKVDIFTLSHFRGLFLTLNDWNITQLNTSDIKMHKMIFSEVSRNGNWTKDDLDFMNSIKSQLLYLSVQFFEDSQNIKQKIQQKSWQNEDTAKHYIEWVNRISKGIKKMASGVYIHRF